MSESLRVYPLELYEKYLSWNEFCRGFNFAMEFVNQLPSTEPKQKKGEWIDEKINSYTSRTYCSECGSSAPFVYKSDDYYGNHAYGETVRTKFCPNCGVEMKGEYG